MAASLILLPAILVSLSAALPQSNALISSTDQQTPSSCPDHLNQNSLPCQLEEAKLKIARLESILGERTGEINAKSEYLRECEKKNEELTVEIDRLKAVFSSFEYDYPRANLKLSALEEEVRLLWAASRKNNFEIYGLEYKALDAERRLKEATSKVEEMAEIVSEQWIQIQQLEQAVHMAEVRTSKVRNELWQRGPFVKSFVTLFGNSLKMVKEILDPYVPTDVSALVFSKSQAFQTFAAAKHYHHQVHLTFLFIYSSYNRWL
ncbi:hypothetical protein BUALT_Bualt18G0112400 [Buddleja alternifolia]|uniref:Uncharacterized protein n=1 Tax=Buddleja alternifolia TaxID=168488 RepID=A0AAV6WCT2_9LAMI|nr:hypothetical protein BUALT_Bualt18G0112400 [Buddleja alternifolia]